MMTICSDAEKCSACGACVNICPKDAISFKANEYGIEYPEINADKCIDCKLCKKVCSAIAEVELQSPIKAFAATHKNKAVLLKSSSGGAFSALAEKVLENGGAVCGCVYDEGFTPVHVCSRKKGDYLRMRKSKYVRSSIGYAYREVRKELETGDCVLFTGTPCQVSGLKAFLGKEYPNLITVDLICHGVPEPTMFKEFLGYLEKKYRTKIKEFDFRSKKYGWQRYTSEFTGENGKTINIGKNKELYMYAFSRGETIRPSCFTCRFATSKRAGDITIGDLWGHEKFAVSCDRKNGISLITVNNEKALRFFETLEASFVCDEVDYASACANNTCLRKPTDRGKRWEKYMEAYKNGEFERVAAKHQRINRKLILREKIKMNVPLRVFRFLKKHGF